MKGQSRPTGQEEARGALSTARFACPAAFPPDSRLNGNRRAVDFREFRIFLYVDGLHVVFAT